MKATPLKDKTPLPKTPKGYIVTSNGTHEILDKIDQYGGREVTRIAYPDNYATLSTVDKRSAVVTTRTKLLESAT